MPRPLARAARGDVKLDELVGHVQLHVCCPGAQVGQATLGTTSLDTGTTLAPIGAAAPFPDLMVSRNFKVGTATGWEWDSPKAYKPLPSPS